MNQSESQNNSWKNIILQPILTTHQVLQRYTALEQAWLTKSHPGMTKFQQQAFLGTGFKLF